ncbi:MAG: NAD(P)/FAD-dependent oxidoreductase [Armatimonadota bacterium]
MDCDCVVVGAGPAGLYCGTYLGRCRRQVIIFDGGKPRAGWIPRTHNFPAFPEGISGIELLQLMRQQCERYGAEIRQERVLSISGQDRDFIVKTVEHELRTSKVVLATGVNDIPPDIPDAEHYKGATIRHCPICDAYEVIDKRVAVIGPGTHAARLTQWLLNYTADLILLTNDNEGRSAINPKIAEKLDKCGIPIYGAKIAKIEEEDGILGTITLEDGTEIRGVSRGYSAMGLKPNSELAESIGAQLDADGYIVADDHQCTTIRGVYAVGDIVSNQIGQLSIGMGHAAKASVAIHNSLLVW